MAGLAPRGDSVAGISGPRREGVVAEDPSRINGTLPTNRQVFVRLPANAQYNDARDPRRRLGGELQLVGLPRLDEGVADM